MLRGASVERPMPGALFLALSKKVRAGEALVKDALARIAQAAVHELQLMLLMKDLRRALEH
jgi:hypothetical protein